MSDREDLAKAIEDAIEELVAPLPKWNQLELVLRVLPICGEEKMEQILKILGFKLGELSLCQNCWCMTKTIDGKCGKCKGDKPKGGKNETI